MARLPGRQLPGVLLTSFRSRFKRIVPDTATVNAGTPTGDIGDIQHYLDGNQLDIQEAAGAPPVLQLTLTFEDVTSLLAIYVLGNYEGSTTHCVDIELWNFTTTAYDILDSFSTRICPGAHTAWVFDDTDYIDSGQTIMRLNHAQSGNTSHDLYLYYIALLY